MKIKTLIFTLTLCTLLLTGCGDSRKDYVFTAGQGVSPAPPVAVDDAYTILGNTVFVEFADGGVLINDTLRGGQITSFDSTTTEGGSVILDSDGGFSYTPPSRFVGVDSFTYTLANEDGDSTATVTLDIDSLAWYVDTSRTSDGTGSDLSPFNSLDSALAEANEGDSIIILGSSAPIHTAGFTLPYGVNLIGQGGALTGPPAKPAEPVKPKPPWGIIFGQGTLDTPTIDGPITLAGRNFVSGLTLENSTGSGATIRVSETEDVVISGNTFRNGEKTHLVLSNVSGTAWVLDNQFEETNSEGHLYVESTSAETELIIERNSFINTNDVANYNFVEIWLAGDSQTNLRFVDNGLDNHDRNKGVKTGLELVVFEDAKADVVITDNLLNELSQTGLDLYMDPAADTTVTVSDNVLVGCSEIGIHSQGQGHWSIDGNTVSGSETGILILGSSSVHRVQQNEVFECFGGIVAEANWNELSNSVVFLVDNLVSRCEFGLVGNNDNTHSDNEVTLYLKIEQNTVIDSVQEQIHFYDTEFANSVRVEEFASLASLNTLVGTAVEIEPDPSDIGQQHVTSVVNGTCEALAD